MGLAAVAAAHSAVGPSRAVFGAQFLYLENETVVGVKAGESAGGLQGAPRMIDVPPVFTGALDRPHCLCEQRSVPPAPQRSRRACSLSFRSGGSRVSMLRTCFPSHSLFVGSAGAL